MELIGCVEINDRNHFGAVGTTSSPGINSPSEEPYTVDVYKSEEGFHIKADEQDLTGDYPFDHAPAIAEIQEYLDSVAEEVKDHITGLWAEKNGNLYILPKGDGYDEVHGPENRDSVFLLKLWEGKDPEQEIDPDVLEEKGFDYISPMLRRWSIADGYYHN